MFGPMRAALFFSLIWGLHSSPFNLDRTLLAVFLISAVRSSSSCLVSEGRATADEMSGWEPRPHPSPPPTHAHRPPLSLSRPCRSRTHSRLGWGQPGWHYAVFSLAPHPLTASRCSPGSLPPGAANQPCPAKSLSQARGPGGLVRARVNGPEVRDG